MPNKCCVPGCRGNYKKGPKVHNFSFPTDESQRKKWVSLIPRRNFVPTKCSRVCHLHFTEDDIIRTVSQEDSRTSESVTIYLSTPRLKRSAVPTKFGNCRLDIRNADSKSASSTSSEDFIKDEKVQRIKEEISDNEQQNKLERSAYKILTSYDNYNEFLRLFRTFRVPANWFGIDEGRKIIIFKLVYSPGPVTSYAVVINSDLKLETFLYGQEISVSTKQGKTPFLSCSLSQISEVLETIDKGTVVNDDFSDNENMKCILNRVTNILGAVEDVGDKRISIISEQLKLHSCPKERYRYSAQIMVFASLLLTISPMAYQFLRHSGFLILPHQKFLTDPSCEENSILSHVRNVLKSLSPKEQLVILSVNEIDIKPYLDSRGSLTTAYAFIINSIYSNFSELVHISATSKTNHESLHGLIKTIISDLEKIGYGVFCVVSNVTNAKAMGSFANKKLSIVYPHPVTNSRPLFFLYDPVHLLKCIKYDWLTSHDQTLSYPDFETGTEKFASFQCLKRLCELECDVQLAFDHSLNLKALFSDRHDASLVNNIFNPSIVQALSKFGKDIDKSEDTADFINIILSWWNVVNDNVPVRSRHVLARNLVDRKLKFLEKMLNWLDVWREGKFSCRLATQTHLALYHTVHGMVEITKYCFEELKLDYVLFSKFQTDPLEHSFGKHRHLAEGHYISARQLYESEKRLIVHVLLTLKSPRFGFLPVEKFFETIDTPDEPLFDDPFNPTVSIDENDFEEVRSEISAVTYLASYCCYSALRKKLRCEFCRGKLVYPEKLVVESSYELVENLKNDLWYPHDVVVQIVLCAYVVFNNLLKNFEEEFSLMNDKRCVISRLVFEYVAEEGYLMHFRGCAIHHEERTAQVIITWVTNTFLKNYYGKNRLGKHKKRKLT